MGTWNEDQKAVAAAQGAASLTISCPSGGRLVLHNLVIAGSTTASVFDVDVGATEILTGVSLDANGEFLSGTDLCPIIGGVDEDIVFTLDGGTADFYAIYKASL